MTSNYSIIHVLKENNRVTKFSVTFNTLRLYILYYITLTRYYIVKDTFR